MKSQTKLTKPSTTLRLLEHFKHDQGIANKTNAIPLNNMKKTLLVLLFIYAIVISFAFTT